MKTLAGTDFFRDGVELRAILCSDKPPHSPHAHDFIEIVYVVKGCAVHNVGRSKYPILAGDIFVINTYERHFFSDINNLQVWYLIVGPPMLRSRLKSLHEVSGFFEFFYVEPLFRKETRFKQHLHLEPNTGAAIEKLLERMRKESEERKPGYKLLLEVLLVEFLVEVSRLYHGFYRKKTSPEEIDSKKQAVKRVRAFIEDKYAEDIRLSELARCGCLQSQYLCRVFKKTTGMTLIEYLTHVRIQKAREMLVQTTDTVTDICYKSGFNGLSYFIRTFRRVTGLTPSRFRKKSK